MHKHSQESLRVLHVVADVAQHTQFEDLHDEDKDAPGAYTYEVPAHLDEEKAAACALGIFHSTVPVKYIADIELTVFNENHEEIEPDYDADWYSLAESCRALWHHHLPDDIRMLREYDEKVRAYEAARAAGEAELLDYPSWPTV